MKRSSTLLRARGSAVLGAAGVLLLVSTGLLVGYFVQVRTASAGSEAPAATAPAKPEAAPADPDQVRAKVAAYLDGSIRVKFDGRVRELAWSDVGASLDESLLSRARLTDGGDLTGLVPIAIDREAATRSLLALKSGLDRRPQSARLDLEGRKVHPEQPGFGIDLFGAVSELEAAARKAAAEVELPGAEIAPAVTVESLGIDDISTVLASFKTRFSISEKSRNDNLKLVASRIDGHIMQPGEVFSFNKVVGARDSEDGYKTAHVIMKGEMVDGMAGGACQISTTLHGAAFFAGIEIVESTPHSRPSTYVQMGLDATVVWPKVDLKLKNNYDFPVAIHYRVARGVSHVEILGRERPYDKIAFERKMDKRIGFETITREDDGIAIGHMVVDQPGFPGYKLRRKRIYYKDGKVVKEDNWNVRYHPVVEYVRMGVNPDPNLAPPKHKKPHGPKPAGNFRMEQ